MEMENLSTMKSQANVEKIVNKRIFQHFVEIPEKLGSQFIKSFNYEVWPEQWGIKKGEQHNLPYM